MNLCIVDKPTDSNVEWKAFRPVNNGSLNCIGRKNKWNEANMNFPHQDNPLTVNLVISKQTFNEVNWNESKRFPFNWPKSFT